MSDRHIHRKVAFFALALAGLVACGDPQLESPVHLTTASATREDGLFVDSLAVRQDMESKVCWWTNGFESEKQWVREALENSWMAATNVRFTGWKTCDRLVGMTPKVHDIQITIKDDERDGPSASSLGLRPGRTQIILNFTFQNWGRGYPSAAGNRRRAIEIIALHEFGHAMGFAHEQNRPDTDRSMCIDDPQGGDGNFTATTWDPDSVMNYCASAEGLSERDIFGAQYFYGTNSDLYFWGDFYRELYEDVRAQRATQDHLAHFRNEGIGEGRLGAPWLDPQWYEKHRWQAPGCDVRYRHDSLWSMVEQYASCGVAKGHAGSAYWDPKYYLRNNPDVAATFGPTNYIAALRHWRNMGINEGRPGSPLFNAHSYLATNSDVANACGAQNYRCAFWHYLRYGRQEGRAAR